MGFAVIKRTPTAWSSTPETESGWRLARPAFSTTARTCLCGIFKPKPHLKARKSLRVSRLGKGIALVLRGLRTPCSTSFSSKMGCSGGGRALVSDKVCHSHSGVPTRNIGGQASLRGLLGWAQGGALRSGATRHCAWSSGWENRASP